MKNYIFLILMILLFCGRAEALEIVYPKTNPVNINASSTFFIGSTNPKDRLEINDIQVKISPNGAFAQVVPLNYGKNEFKIISTPQISSNDNVNKTDLKPQIVDFIIERPKPIVTSSSSNELLEYPIMDNFYVKKDNAPLRMTPVDGGINRLTHLPKDIQLSVNGEKSGFYRVYLNSKLTGWISKVDVEQKDTEKKQNIAAMLISYKINDENGFIKYEFELDKEVPFIVKEEKGLSLQLFNVTGKTDNTLSINVPVKKLIGYEAYYDSKCGGKCEGKCECKCQCNANDKCNENCSEKFILKVRKYPQINLQNPLKDITVVIDAGHGGNEFGAMGCCGDKEKDINLAIAAQLKTELEARGAKVFMTRTDDVYVSLQDRVNFAKSKDAALLISIHANALPDGADPLKCRGTSVYYYYNQAKPLANDILNSMTVELGMHNDQVRQGSLALVRPTSSVSVLVETAYIINPDDYALLTDKCFQSKCAKAIADGIAKYLLDK